MTDPTPDNNTLAMGPGTPLPWRVDYRDICQLRDNGANLLVIGTMTGGFHDDAIAEKDAAYIVRACNSFPALIGALEEARRYAGYCYRKSEDADFSNDAFAALTMIDAALATARGEQEA